MLDIGKWHQSDLDSLETLELLARHKKLELVARRVIENDTKRTRALLFDALLELDKEVYVKQRAELEKVINPYR